MARHLATAGVVGLYASPQRRARQTAAPIALATGLDVNIDERQSERMNWDGHESAEAFVAEWNLTVTDREYVPTRGDSSIAAAARFELFLEVRTGAMLAAPSWSSATAA